MLKMTVDAGRKANIPVSVCGEMAGDLEMTPLLIGLGIHNLGAARAFSRD